MSRDLSDVYVNKVGVGTTVLKGGKGKCEDGVIILNLNSGVIVDGGPQEGNMYVVGSSQKIYYDVTCTLAIGNFIKFNLKKNDDC